MIKLIEPSKSGEMFIEDQDEDVEEEEEFHDSHDEKNEPEVKEEEKVEQQSDEKSKETNDTKIEEANTADRADLMPSNIQGNDEQETKTSDPEEQPVDQGDEAKVEKEEIVEEKSEEANGINAEEADDPKAEEADDPKAEEADDPKAEEANDTKAEEAKTADCADLTPSNIQGNDEQETKTSDPEEQPVDQGDEAKVEKEEIVEEKSEEANGTKAEEAKTADWADLMLSNIQGNGEQETKTSDPEEQPVDQGDEAKVEKQEKVEEKNEENTQEADKKELDLDEDVKNPQYIPKKGVFYEHDDRSADADKKQPSTSSTKKDDETTEPKDSSSNKKAGNTQEKQGDLRRGSRRQRTETDRWNHDLFRDEKQKPKSKSELINAYGFDIRHERSSRNQAENRPPRGSNNNTAERQQTNPDNQRSRQNRDNRNPRQNQPSNRSGDRRSRRVTNRNRIDSSAGSSVKRDVQNSRPIKQDLKEGVRPQEVSDAKQSFPPVPSQTVVTPSRREQQDVSRDKNTRMDGRVRRQNSRDRPVSNSADDKLPPINTVMPPITTWSNKIEDMVKEEATRKESPSRHQQQHIQGMNNNAKSRSNDFWPQNQQNKNIYHERTIRNMDDGRHQQHFNARRYQDRDEGNKSSMNKNHYNDRSNQHHQEWRRNNHYNSSHIKPNEYEPIKTQTFENSRLAQANMNRSNFRDAREIINERRMQHNFQLKVQPGSSGSDQGQVQHHNQQQQQHQQQLVQHQQLIQHQNQQLLQHQQASQHMRQIPSSSSPQRSTQNQPHQQPNQLLSAQAPQQLQNQQLHNPRQQQVPQTQHPSQSRQNLVMNNNLADGVHESSRLNTTTANSNELINSRPIIKTDSYTGANVAPGSQQPPALQQHSQNHRSISGPMSQQVPSSAGSHMLPSHLNAGGTQAQYYTQSGSSRESAAAAAALATAYHGYIPSGHSVMDATRYHMTSQQLSEHGYMASPGQATEVAAASVLHPQGLYTDAASAGGTVASSAYLAQAGSTLSPSTNIPVTGAGPPPLAPVSYLQHSQYAPPPYSNPYSQPQHNQTPPQSSHAYQYWTYI